MKGTFYRISFHWPISEIRKISHYAKSSQAHFGFIRNDNSIFVKGRGKPGRFAVTILYKLSFIQNAPASLPCLSYKPVILSVSEDLIVLLLCNLDQSR
jgi:hypothetical protein